MTCDEFVRSAVHRKTHSFYTNNEMPTLKKVLTAINTDHDLSNLMQSSLYNPFKKLNLEFIQRNRKNIIVESYDILHGY